MDYFESPVVVIGKRYQATYNYFTKTFRINGLGMGIVVHSGSDNLVQNVATALNLPTEKVHVDPDDLTFVVIGDSIEQEGEPYYHTVVPLDKEYPPGTAVYFWLVRVFY